MQTLKETEFNWHADQPDVPGKSAEAMKAFFDAPTRALMDKINEIIGSGEATDLSTLLEQLGKKADAAEYLLMIRGLQEAHNDQNGWLRELDERLTAEAAALKESDATLNERADYIGHDVSALRGEYEDWKLTEFYELQQQVSISGTEVGNLLERVEPLETEQESLATVLEEQGAMLTTLDQQVQSHGIALDQQMQINERQYGINDEVGLALEALKEAVQNIEGGGGGSVGSGVQGLAGEHDIEDLPVGMSYAAENVTLQYLADPEIEEYGYLDVPAGALILKTVGQIESGVVEGEWIDGALTVYVMSRSGKLTRIVPSHDMYGIRYEVSEEDGNIIILGGVPTDPDYQLTGSEVLSVTAVMNYVDAQILGGEW